jgi:hypothetical protein
MRTIAPGQITVPQKLEGGYPATSLITSGLKPLTIEIARFSCRRSNTIRRGPCLLNPRKPYLESRLGRTLRSNFLGSCDSGFSCTSC